MNGRLGSEVRQSLALLFLTATTTAGFVGIGLLAARFLG
jgi:hypothetical protein